MAPGVKILRPQTARVMEGFGSTYNPRPLLAVDAQINGPKGRIMARQEATPLARQEALAETAALQDTEEALNALLQSIRVVSVTDAGLALVLLLMF